MGIFKFKYGCYYFTSTYSGMYIYIFIYIYIYIYMYNFNGYSDDKDPQIIIA